MTSSADLHKSAKPRRPTLYGQSRAKAYERGAHSRPAGQTNGYPFPAPSKLPLPLSVQQSSARPQTPGERVKQSRRDRRRGDAH